MRRYVLLCSLWCAAQTGYGQTYDELLNRASKALGDKSYCTALQYFQQAFIDTTRAGTYDLAFGAVAAANCQKSDVAMMWLWRSMAKGLGQNPGETEQIVNDASFAVLHRHKEWPKWVKSMRDSQSQRDIRVTKQRTDWFEVSTKNAVPFPEKGEGYAKASAGFAQYNSLFDTLNIPYLVRVPEGYTPTKGYPLVVYLHGGVVSTEMFQNLDPQVVNEPIFKIAPNAFILYPYGRKSFGWVNQKEAFQHVLTAITEVKRRYCINSKHVYLGGMSNGATAAFWYAAHFPTEFAGFFAFSPGPTMAIDEQTFSLISSAAVITSVSAKDDSVYPYDQVQRTYDMHRQQAARWLFKTIDNGGHGFIYSPEGLIIMQQTISDLMSK